MILYFADRKMDIKGQASTELRQGYKVKDDVKVEDIESGVASFECRISYKDEDRAMLEEMASAGNYLLRSHDNENEFYTIIDSEFDTKSQEVYIYAEDAGLDLLNEVAQPFTADKAYPITSYINKWINDSGFEIGRNEVPKSSERKLSWDSEATVTERLASIATQFGNYEISYSFEMKGLFVTRKLVNIYKKRGKDTGEQLRLNKEVDRIITKKSVANLATAFSVTGGTIEQNSTVLKATSSTSPKVAYEVDLETTGRTATSVKITADISAGLTTEGTELGEEYGLKASIYMGGKWFSATIKATDDKNKQKWSGGSNHSTEYSFTVPVDTAAAITFSDIKFKVERTDSKGGSVGVLAETLCEKFTVPNYIKGGENGEEINSRPITLEGYKYDDGDFYVGTDGILRSRKANKKWSRYVWNNEPNRKTNAAGYICKTYTYDTSSQQTLCTHAITALKKVCDMEINFEIDIKKLPKGIKIGDRVYVIDDHGELYLQTRLLKLETSATRREKNATLGEHLIKESGISQKVIDLAEKFAKMTVSVTRAKSIAETAKAAASEAKGQVDEAIKSVEEAQKAVNEVVEVVETAKQSAAEAQAAAANAQAVVDSVEDRIVSIENTLGNAQQAAENAQQAAVTATQKAQEAETSATNAANDAKEAKKAASTAQEHAENAAANAGEAYDAAATAQAEAKVASATANAAKKDAERAEADIKTFTEELQTLTDTMKADYSRKTDLTEATANLQSQISRNAGKISQNVIETTMIDETANNALTKVQAAQKAATEAQALADQASADAIAAQTAAEEAQEAAVAAQNEADIAKAAADTAQGVADKAEADLRVAEENLATVSGRIDATEEEIAAAQKAVDDAQAVASSAKEAARAAVGAAKSAQEVANAAVDTVTKAQANANRAVNEATIAQQVADTAKGNAEKAQRLADEAQATAVAAQAAANTAKAQAEQAQAAADNAYLEATAAQVEADNAAEKANKAEADLATAQQRLAEIQQQANATTEELTKAQAAVDTAQVKATEARVSATAAQAAATEANAEAEEAQTAANAAKVAADTAQAEAKTAQDEVDKALGLVYSLEKRVTTAETGLEQTKSEIRLFAKKDEVIRTLGGYYTKEQANAEIMTKANEINLSVDTKVAGVKVGGRNLLKNSRHITLSSNNSALYPVAYTTETENGREFRRYRRTETALNPTTMSLYSAIPVNQITECLTGQKITFSFLIRCSHSTTTNTMNALVVNGTSQNFAETQTHNIGSQWQRISLTADITREYEVNGSNILRFNPLMIVIPNDTIDEFYIDVCEWKIEKGNKATDWSPAPEDVDDKFNNYSTTEEMQAAINISKEGIFSSVRAEYSTKEELNNLDIGGRNLVRDSSLKEFTDMWAFDSNNTYSFLNGYCELFRTTASGSRTFNTQSTNKNTLLKPDGLAGGTFTLSAEIKLLDGYSITDASTLFYRCNTNDLSSRFQEVAVNLGSATDKWKRVHATFTFGDYNFDGACQVCIALADIANTGLCIRNIKLEKGNKPTDWTPAPEDIDSTDAVDNLQQTVDEYSDLKQRLADAESQIAQLNNTISMLVRDAQGQSQMTQDSESVEYAFFSTEEIDKAIDTLGELNTAHDGTKEAVEALQKQLAAYGERVEFTTYEDEPCIILREADSNYKQIITNTRRIFVQGDEVKSVTDFDKVKSPKVIASENLQIGGFAWKNREANRISLMWEGVDE